MRQNVVVVGAGLGGLATAVAAAERGHRVTVLEKSDQAGGAASWSGGQVWVAANHHQREEGLEDSLEDAAVYVRHVGASHPELIDETALQRWLSDAARAAEEFERLGAVRWQIIPDYPDYYQDAPGARTTGRYLTATYDGAKLGRWRDRLRVSPHFPVGRTYDEILSAGLRASAFSAEGVGTAEDQDLLSFGTGVVAGFLTAALERDVEILLNHPVVDLQVTEGAVAGAVAQTPDGEHRAVPGTVVIATSGFDWDDDLAREHLGLEPDERGSVAPRTLTGDGLQLATQAGADVTHIPAQRVPIQIGYPSAGEPGYAVAREHSLPHTFIVDASGRRFCDDAVYWEVIKAALGEGRRHLPCFMIWDEQHHRRYGLGTTPPGGTYPAEVVASAPTLADLGATLGIDGNELERTALRFNDLARQDVDEDFGRGTNATWRRFQGDPSQPGNPNLGEVRHPPFFGMRLTLVSTGIGLTGVTVDPDGRALDVAGAPIPGLYAVGAAAAFTSSGTAYNSGFSLSRAISLGLAAAEDINRGHADP